MKGGGIVWAAVSTRPQANEDEHFSIPKQIEDGKRFFESQGIPILDVLVVPGHSRSYRTLDALATDARKRQIDAFDKLIDHLRDADFAYFFCRDANRFARKASLLHYIVESIIEDVGAKIYSQNDSLWVDESNMDMWATMKGFTVRSEVKWLVSATEDGLKKRAERGLPTTRVPFSHRYLRDDKLKVTGVEIDESKRRLFDDLARLVVEERTPFNGIERVLFERFGHVARDGQPYGDNVMYYFLHHPLTWGVTAHGYHRRGQRTFLGTWTFDEGEPPPEGVNVNRGLVPPVYTGEQGEALKAELRRRKGMEGTRRPATTSAFSGLFMCGGCGYSMVVLTNDYGRGGRTPYALRCNSTRNHFHYRPDCDQTKNVPIARVREYLDTLLRELLETRDLSALVPEAKTTETELARLALDIHAAAAALDNLIDLQAAAHPSTQAAYQRRIDAAGQQLEALQRRQRELKSQQQRQRAAWHTAGVVLDTIAGTIDHFWEQDEVQINQTLDRLLGSRRLVILNGEVIGAKEKPPRRKLKQKS